MKKTFLFLITLCCVLSLFAANVYITPDADGTGDGSSWESPMTLGDYLAAAHANSKADFVRLKAGKYTVNLSTGFVSGNYSKLTLSGGYAGTDDTTLDEENPYSEIDFANTPTGGNYGGLICSTKYNYGWYYFHLERLKLTRARSSAVYKYNNGELKLTDCVVVSNGWRNYSSWNTYGGRGVRVGGGGRFYATDCVIAYNGMYSYPGSGTSDYGDNGFGLYINGTSSEIKRCKIYGNGTRVSSTATDGALRTLRCSSSNSRGMGVYVTGSKLTAVDCDFVCNKSPMGYYDKSAEQGRGMGGGGSVVLVGASGGSIFSNCSFVANMNVRDHSYGRYNTDFGGALNVNLSSPSAAVNVENCTFAYNMTDSYNAAPGLEAWKGIVNVRNSIFVGNHKPAQNALGSDINVRTGAVVNVSYSLFSATNEHHVTVEKIGEDSGTLTMEGITLGDAALASATTASTNLITSFTKNIQSSSFTCMCYGPSEIENVIKFDVHPCSKTGRWNGSQFVQDKLHSPAIDAGDPTSGVLSETKPHGYRLNLGRYGGTAEASQSRKYGLLIYFK